MDDDPGSTEINTVGQVMDGEASREGDLFSVVQEH